MQTRDDRVNRVRLSLLGPAEAAFDGRPIVFRTKKALALLAYLAVDPGPHPRERLAELFWPQAGVLDARASLRTTLNYLRQALGCHADRVLIATREMIGVLPTSLELDVDALADAQRLVRQSQDRRVRHQIESVIQRYRGPFLSSLFVADAAEFESWIEAQRAYWRGIAAGLLDHLATLQTEAGDSGAAVATLERWTAVNPDEEVAWQRLVEAHLRQDDRAGARRAWDAYARAMEELNAAPSLHMNRLRGRLRGGTRNAGEPGPSGFDDLDHRGGPVVGWEQEWALLNAALRHAWSGRTEVVALIGPPSVGQTCLAAEFTSSVRSAGTDVVAGRAFESLGALPYAAVIEALRPRLEAENAPEDLLSDLWLAELSRLLPELRERYPDLPALQEDSLGRGRIFEAVTRLGMALAGHKPLVLFLDDVQWADADTRDLLRYAVRRWSESKTRVLLVLTARIESSTYPELERWLDGLTRETRTSLVQINPLRQRDVMRPVEVRSSNDKPWRLGLARAGAMPRLAFAASGSAG